MERRRNANETQMIIWANDGSELLYGYPNHALPITTGVLMGTEIGKWFASNGQQGMKPEDAYARARTEWAKERTEAIEAIIDANPHLDDKQKAMARKQSTVAAARELIATYPRVANQNEPARMGMEKNPKLGAPETRAIEGGLPPEESAAMARSMGARADKPQPPHVNTRGRFSMGNMTPTQLREAIAKGNDPRNLFPSTLGA